MVLKNIFQSIQQAKYLFTYNVKVIFGSRFLYFFAASFLFYCIVTAINLFSDEVLTIDSVYSILLFPGLLFIFFPTVFGIQNDADSRILEIVFGIPNYRYRVYFVRLLIILLMEFAYLLCLSFLTNYLLINIPIFSMAVNVMLPIVFFGMLGFAFSTVVRNGNGTIVVVVLVGILLWILAIISPESIWNVFLNPFAQSSEISDLVWQSKISQNQTIVLSASVVLLLWGLLNLQKRERFMS